MRRAKIVCTLGPATDSPEQVQALVDAGMNVARINRSHGRAEDQEVVISRIREAAAASGRAVAILVDLQGPKIRLGRFVDDQKVMLNKGDEFTITIDDVLGTVKRASTTFKGLPGDCRPGDRLLIDDGNVAVRVVAVTDTDVVTKVEVPGYVSNNKGINLPGVAVSVPALSEKDRDDLRWALKIGADLIALSFVRDADDIKDVHEIMDEVGVRIPVIAKIEKPQAVENLFDIVSTFDGIMVARGDLGVEVPLEEVPLVQKRAIQIARENAKPVIVATQMLDSMIENSRPTRAEASDVANAVLDGADAVMLSGETSVGRDPQNVVSTMSRIVKSAEADGEVPQLSHMPRTKRGVISYSARDIAERLNAKALVAFTTSGDTARRVARLHTHLPLLVFTPNQEVRSQLALTWGAQTFLCPVVDSTDSMMREIDEALLAMDEYNRDDMMVVVAGTPPGVTGNTNMIHVHPLGEDLHRNVKEDLNKAIKETAKKESKKAKPAVKKK